MANDSGSDGASHDQYVQGTGRIGILAGVGPWPAWVMDIVSKLREISWDVDCMRIGLGSG